MAHLGRPSHGQDFNFVEDPERPGWLHWGLAEHNRYNSTLGPMWVRQRDDGIVIARTEPGHLQGNLGNHIHGGAMLTQMDIALFVCARIHGALGHGPAVTIDLNTHFIGAGQLGHPLDAEVEVLRETGRLMFMRGLMTQNDNRVAAFTGTIRKTKQPAA